MDNASPPSPKSGANPKTPAPNQRQLTDRDASTGSDTAPSLAPGANASGVVAAERRGHAFYMAKLPPQSAAKAVGWMLLSCALLSGVAVLGRFIALEGVPIMQIMLLRLGFAVLAMTPLLIARGPSMLHTEHWRIYAVRITVGLIGMATFFGALELSSVGEVTAIAFLVPLIATMGAALFLGEKVGPRRWAAIAVGFVGALVILRPGVVPAGAGAILAVASAVAMAGASLFVKVLSVRDGPDKVVLISTLAQTIVMLIPGLWVWQALSAELWFVAACMGLFGMLGHVTLARALRAADTSVVMGADFARLPFGVLFGYLMFGELIDFWTWVGAGIIFAAARYAARRARRAKAQSKN